MMYFKLAIRLLTRDIRSGELTLLVLALLIAVASSTTISLFTDRLQRTLKVQAAEFLAGDLVISSSAPVDAGWLEEGRALKLKQSQTVEFMSVLLENSQTLLVGVKAVGPNYPLRGFLKIRDAVGVDEKRVDHGPSPGTVWVDSRVLSALDLHLGEMLTVGERPLRIERLISYEPDKRGVFYSFSPRVMINQADLQATGVIQPGSHVHYYFQFIGEETNLSALKRRLKPQLNASEQILDIQDDRPEFASALRRTERYLGLSGIVVVLIAGVAISMAAGRYTERHMNASAMLRCLGCRQTEIVRLYLYQFLLLGVFSSAAGCLIGWFGQIGLWFLLKSLLPVQSTGPGWLAVMFGFTTGIVVLLGFALPPLLRLRQVPPLRVLRRELAPLPAQAWLIYGFAAFLTTGLIWLYTEDWRLTISVVGVSALVLLIAALAIGVMLQAWSHWLPHLGVVWRFGMQGLTRNRKASVGQILAFSVVLAAMSLSLTVRDSLIEQWEQQLPERAPNHFVLNIVPDQLEAFKRFLARENVASSHFYPIVRGRLVAVNDEAVQRRVSKDSRGDAATRRDLSLTSATTLPEDNIISAGAIWPEGQAGWVSVEQKLANNLGITVGDSLIFTIGSAQVKAKVANLRSVEWDTMRPNFYMIFSPGTLGDFPATYLTSFFLGDDQKGLLNGLVKSFPAITIFEVDQVLKQLQGILKQLSEAINFLLLFALLAGFTVLFASVYATQDQRIQVAALTRTLGAQRRWIQKAFLIEFGVLGVLTGVLAVVIAQACLYVLFTYVMSITYQLPVLKMLAIPALGVLLIVCAGYLGVRGVMNRTPMSVLRRL